jgi:dienelactone hydrolase
VRRWRRCWSGRGRCGGRGHLRGTIYDFRLLTQIVRMAWVSGLRRIVARRAEELLLLGCVLLLSSPAAARTEQYRTYVAATPAETMQGPCEYELTLRDASKPVKAIFVIVERGWQVGNLYFNHDVTAFAERHDLALMLARHCRSKTEEDMDVVPEHGLGRGLLEAINQFAEQSRHPELATNKLILFSFSGGGSFVARMVAFAPDRILAAVEYAPGHREPLGIDTVNLPEKALSVPQFIIANGADNICGTERPYAYFMKYHNRAPLTFMVQNAVPHCCVMNVTNIVLLWLADVIQLPLPGANKQYARNNSKDLWRGFIRTEIGNVKDDWREPVWNVADAWIKSRASTAPSGAKDAGWMPSKRFAEAWLAFEKEREHPITPLE